MTAPDTPLGFRKIDPESDQHRLAYQWINDNADTADEMLQADRSRIAALEAGATAVDPSAPKPAFGKGMSVGPTRVLPGIDGQYAAFPSATVLSDGRLFLVWRQATDHLNTRDGVVKASTSSDHGLTWSTAYTLFQDETAGIDLRDPTASTSPDKQTLYVTYLKGSASLNAGGFYLRISTDQGETFGAEIRIDPHPYSAGTAPIVTLPNGQLLATWYGKENLGDAKDSSFYSLSADGGQTWGAPVKFADGVAAGRDYQEPYASVYGDTVVIMFRWGNADQIGMVKSTNGGATFSAPAAAFTGTGRPSNLITSNGTLVVVYRNWPGGTTLQHGMVRTSHDFGATWGPARLVERTNPNFWLYSGPVEVAPGMIFCPTSVESSSTSAKLSMRYLVDGGGITPYGDVTLSGSEKAVQRASGIAVADSFDRADGPLVQSDNGVDWFGTDNKIAIVDRALQCGDNTAIHVPYINAVATDYEIEAEVSWTGNAGAYLVFRYQNSTNYLMFGVESGGSVVRLYKVVNGTATQLGTASLAFPAGPFHKLRVSTIGDTIRCYVEDVSVIAVTDTTGSGMPWCGVRIGASGAALVHRIRNFVVRRRGGGVY